MSAYQNYSKFPELVLAATKFLDLILILPNEEFNLLEWMFISDKNVDGALANYFAKHAYDTSLYTPFVNKLIPKKPPTHKGNTPLGKIRPTINLPFEEMSTDGFLTLMSHFNDIVYNNSTSGGKVDFRYIEEQLVRDFTETESSPTTD